KWHIANHIPFYFGVPLAPPVVVNPPAPPPPVVVAPPQDKCVHPNPDWAIGSDCKKWADCVNDEQAPNLQLCKCSLKRCTTVLDAVANEFSDLSGSTESADFFAKNQFRDRALSALKSIADFREQIGKVDLKGSFFGTNDVDHFNHCVYAR